MLRPSEVTELAALRQRAGLHWTILVIVVLLLAAAPTGVYILTDGSHGAHIFGNSESYTAQVVSSQADGRCGT